MISIYIFQSPVTLFYVSPPSEEIQVTTEPDDDVPNGFTVIENVRERLYAEREGFCAPTLAQDDDENNSGKLVEDQSGI